MCVKIDVSDSHCFLSTCLCVVAYLKLLVCVVKTMCCGVDSDAF